MSQDRAAALQSTLLLSPRDTLLLVVDLQEKLMPLIEGEQRVLLQSELLIDAAKILEVPVLVTEQYPRGLGRTVPHLAAKLPQAIDKTIFSCCGEPQVMAQVGQSHIRKILLCGIEAHVCIQQTAFDLLANGLRVYVAADAVGSRTGMDRHWALHRMQMAGITITTAETAVFEWTRRSGTEEFKRISERIKEHAVLLEKAGLARMQEP